jgi:hypothetical protein
MADGWPLCYSLLEECAYGGDGDEELFGQRETLLEVVGIVVAEEDVALGILPGEGLEGEVDGGERCGEHEGCASAGVAEDEELGRRHVEADFLGFAGVIDAGEDGDAFGAEDLFEAVEGVGDGVGTGEGDDAVGHGYSW